MLTVPGWLGANHLLMFVSLYDMAEVLVTQSMMEAIQVVLV